MTIPASTCSRCSQEGRVSGDQRSHTSRGRPCSGDLAAAIRFHCICGHEWTCNGREAEAQGRFLDKAGLR